MPPTPSRNVLRVRPAMAQVHVLMFRRDRIRRTTVLELLQLHAVLTAPATERLRAVTGVMPLSAVQWPVQVQRCMRLTCVVVPAPARMREQALVVHICAQLTIVSAELPARVILIAAKVPSVTALSA